MISKVLIANRGEIAVRIIRTCRKLGIRTVAVYSDADRFALHTRLADEAIYIGGAEASQSYLDQEKLLSAIKQSGADAVHPGYGFVSENASFAKLLEDNKIIFIGPPSEVIAAMGDKIAAKLLAKKAGVPLVPGSESAAHGSALEREIVTFAATHGFPILLKAASGGGGRGIRTVSDPAQIASLAESAAREAKTFFSDDRIFIEKLVKDARHIEVQIFGDNYGEVRALGLRDCSMQRNHQKVIEEAPAFGLSDELKESVLSASERLGKASGYRGAGTVEFLLDPDGQFYFLEVNSRLQVEHPVTELVTGLDLVELQIAIANGGRLNDLLPDLIPCNGHAVELRICAEMPEHGFRAATGKVRMLRLPQCNGFAHTVRVDFGYEVGDSVSHYYDSLLGKVIVHASTRLEAIHLAKKALADFLLCGVSTNAWYLQHLMQADEFVLGSHKITTANALVNDNCSSSMQRFALASAVTEVWLRHRLDTKLPDAWKSSFDHLSSADTSHWEINGTPVQLKLSELSPSLYSLESVSGNVSIKWLSQNLSTNGLYEFSVAIANSSISFCAYESIDEVWLSGELGGFLVRKLLPSLRSESTSDHNSNLIVESPLPGTIIGLSIKAEQQVQDGDVLCTLESMKMEHQIRAHKTGIIKEISIAIGSVVDAGAQLFVLD